MWLTLVLAPLVGCACAWLLSRVAPAGFEGRFEGRLWPWPGGAEARWWLVAAAVLPWLWHRWRRRGLDPWRVVVRVSEPGPGYREAPAEAVVEVPEARSRYVPLYLERLGVMSLLLAPVLMPTEHWHYFNHIGCPCELPITKSTLQIMLQMGLCALIVIAHAPSEGKVFGAKT